MIKCIKCKVGNYIETGGANYSAPLLIHYRCDTCGSFHIMSESDGIKIVEFESLSKERQEQIIKSIENVYGSEGFNR